MNVFWVNLFLSITIAVPALLIVIRWRSISSVYYPFAFFLWTGTLNELLSIIIVLNGYHNTVTANCYVLIAYTLLLFQFFYWTNWKRRTLVIMIAVGILVWISDNLLWHALKDNNSFFRMYYSIACAVLAIQVMSRQVMEVRTGLHRNAVFMICLAFTISYVYKAYYESFNLFHIEINANFYKIIWSMLSMVNVVAYSIYTYAILCIQKKSRFIMPF